MLQNSVLVAFNAFMTLKGGKLTLSNLLGFFDVELGSELIGNEVLTAGFSEHDPHCMMHVCDLDERLA